MAGRLSLLVANAQANVFARLLNGGYLRIYGGEMPLSPEEPVEDPLAQPLLAELRFGTPAFQEAQGGRVQAYPLAPELSARQAGQATWFRCQRADGTAIWDGLVGETEEHDLMLDSTAILLGAEVNIYEFTYTVRRDEGGPINA